jgi:hypothetical protein
LTNFALYSKIMQTQQKQLVIGQDVLIAGENGTLFLKNFKVLHVFKNFNFF